jgi:nitrate/nitrite transport system substrate-binding protein
MNKRRTLLKSAGAAGLLSLVPDAIRAGAWAQGSDAPEKKEVKIGFIPLTDCSSVVMASVMKFDEKYGIKITPSKEASWAAVRDKLVNGELDAAHVLYGLIYGVQMGIGGPKKDMNILMNLNHNGQAFTLSRKLYDRGVKDAASLGAFMKKEKGEYTFAQTFPTGTHAMWIYYWLAAHGIHPFQDAKAIVVPPPQMVANMKVGTMDAFCVGEPWNDQLVNQKLGYTAAVTGEIWRDHPEKSFALRADFVERNPRATEALTAAVIEAQRWCDEPANKAEMCAIVGRRAWFNVPVADILARSQGNIDYGDGRKVENSPLLMKFWRDHASYPFRSHDLWFLTEDIRWGVLPEATDTAKLIGEVNREGIWRAAADRAGVPNAEVPSGTSRGRESFFDGKVFDPENPTAYLASLSIKKTAAA